MTLLRGRLDGLEVALSGPDLGEALVELEARLAEQPTFYRGVSAIVNFGDNEPSETDVTRLRGLLEGAGIELRAISGTAPCLDELARAQSLQYEPAESRLSDSARSLVADFAGARDDIAQRRRRGEASVRRARFDPVEAPRPVELRLVDAAPTTLYHAATLRGGQTLHHNGNIVVVGDVNPGAELVATGDILVFGRLAGTAHAGAQGNAEARIFALNLAATQLRIATVIAAEEAGRRDAPRAEAAVVREGQIAIVALDRLDDFQTRGASLG